MWSSAVPHMHITSVREVQGADFRLLRGRTAAILLNITWVSSRQAAKVVPLVRLPPGSSGGPPPAHTVRYQGGVASNAVGVRVERTFFLDSHPGGSGKMSI